MNLINSAVFMTVILFGLAKFYLMFIGVNYL